ncbi:MAG TPA: DUF29 domain-containing protein [Stellaceae bacterium]
MPAKAAYDDDFYLWTQEQAAALREAGAARTNAPLDWENLAEEIESLGRSDFRSLRSHVIRIIEHLLKLEHSPARDPRSGWERTVILHRAESRDITQDSPSLRRRLDAALADCYRDGRRLAERGLREDSLDPSALPVAAPYTLDQILDEDWWPANRHGLS